MVETEGSSENIPASTRRIPISLRRIVTPRTVRVSVLKPILNIARFFVGDTIPRVDGPNALYDAIKSHKDRGIEVSKADTMLLTKLIALLLKHGKDPNNFEKVELYHALRLLSGLVLYVIEDDYFFIPTVTEHASHEKLGWLALKLAKAHDGRTEKLEKTISALNLKFNCASELSVVEAGLPPYMLTKEIKKALVKLKVHLVEGEKIFGRHTQEDRKDAHQTRLNEAYRRSWRLIARLISIPPSADHPKLRKRIIGRELRAIELDALGAKYLSEAEQTDQAEQLLAETEQNFGEVVNEANKEELATRIKEVASQVAVEGQAAESDEDAGWFFDMD
ncbi:MAG: hypothetical protein P1V97_07355 [Planctomycetota bacterium]|nr:hypothetical protein [Planctomycetota bacterium]